MTWYMLLAGGLFAGGIIGFAAGVLGIGGGLLAIPLLGIVLGMDQQMAQGTALIMVLPAVLATVRKYNQKERIDLKAAGMGALASMVFTWIGADIALGLDPTFLRRIYAVFVLAIAIFYFYQSARGMRAHRQNRKPVPRRKVEEFNRGWFALLGVISGIISGIFGVGGSVMVVPMLTTWFRLSQTDAQALALSMIIPGIFVALTAYGMQGQADWLVGAPLAVGSLLLVPYGVRLAFALPEPRLKLTFACMLLVIMVLLLLTS